MSEPITVKLETLCGCSKYILADEYSAKNGIYVPIDPPIRIKDWFNDAEFDPADERFRKRLFQWDGWVDEDRNPILKEQWEG